MSRPKGRRDWEGHEKTADKINTLDLLRPHLCDAAYSTKKRREKDLHPEWCAACESPCCYGQRLIELMREQGKEYSNGRKIYVAGDIAIAFRDAPAETNIRRVLRRRTRSAHK